MAKAISLLYRTVLTNGELTVGVQQQILKYGVRNRDLELLAQLTRHSALDASVEAELAALPYAVVKAAWASRPSRTTTELEALVVNERRVKILAALAALEGLPEKVYETLAKCEGVTALVALATNEAAPLEARTAAAGRAAGILSLESKIPNALSLLATQPEFAPAIGSEARHSSLLLTALETSALDETATSRALKLLAAEVEALVIKHKNPGLPATVQYWVRNHIHDAAQLVSSIWNAAKSNSISDDDLQRCRSVAKDVLNIAQRGQSSHWTAQLKTVVKEMSSSQNSAQSIVTALRNASSPEELEALIEKHQNVLSLGGNGGRAAVYAVARSPHLGVERLRQMSSARWLDWHSVQTLMRTTPDPDRLGALMALWPWWTTEMLEKAKDPRAALAAMIKYSKQWSTTLPQDILSSKWLDSDLAAELPLQCFYPANANSVTAKRLAELLESKLTEQRHWEHFETLGSSFNGSINDLLEVANRL